MTTFEEMLAGVTNSYARRACDVELARFSRAFRNIEQACEDGRISEHDRDERIARLEQGTANRIAWLTSSKRPVQRQIQPLDDPDAGRVG